jgi:hypothetical protein
MRCLFKTGISLGILVTIVSISYAEIHRQQLPFPGTQESIGVQQVMKVIGKVNLRQMDRSSKQAFDEFFARKNQLNESVQMLEKATAVRQTTAGVKAPPPRFSPKAY